MGGFREFISRGNVVDLAVAVIIGAAFISVVGSLTEDLLMPVIGWLIGDLDFSNYFVLLGSVPEGTDPSDYAALKAAGVPMLGYGQFLSAIVHFLIVAFIIYLTVRGLKRAMQEKAAAEAEASAPETPEVLLLREIRDELRNRPEGSGRGDPFKSGPESAI